MKNHVAGCPTIPCECGFTLYPGQVVQLRSGGPPMTVRYVIPKEAAESGKESGVAVDLYDDRGHPVRTSYAREQLIRLLDVEVKSDLAQRDSKRVAEQMREAHKIP